MARLTRKPLVERQLLRAKSAWDWSVAKAVIGFLSVAQKLPVDRSIAAAEKIGRFCAPVLPRSGLARRNLALAFPEKSKAEINRMVRGVWGNVARTIAEYVFLDQLFDFDINNPDSGRVEVVGADLFGQLRDAGKPVILFTAHTGNWEILPVAAAAYDLKVTALFRPPNNPYLAKRVLEARTTAMGHLVPSKAGAAWALSNTLERDEAVGLLADQAFRRGPRITFFGREATANPLASTLAQQYDCAIHPARCVRLAGGRFRLELHDAIPITRTANGAVDVAATTATINSVIEGWVREYPEQWLWLHDRWKIKGPPPKKWARPA